LNKLRQTIAIGLKLAIPMQSFQSILAIHAQLHEAIESHGWQRTVLAAAIQSALTFRFLSTNFVDRDNIFPFLRYWTPVLDLTGGLNALNSDSEEVCHSCDE
jgi:hypothetical protein